MMKIIFHKERKMKMTTKMAMTMITRKTKKMKTKMMTIL